MFFAWLTRSSGFSSRRAMNQACSTGCRRRSSATARTSPTSPAARIAITPPSCSSRWPEHQTPARLIADLEGLEGVTKVSTVPTFERIYGKRVIVIGGGAQVGMVAQGAISEADRHNIRGERISVDTIPLVGEDQLAAAVRAVARLHRARALVLAGALMGGDISTAVREIREVGILVLCTNMAGSVPDAADLVVSDPVEAGVMAVMLIADTAKFDIEHVRGKRF